MCIPKYVYIPTPKSIIDEDENDCSEVSKSSSSWSQAGSSKTSRWDSSCSEECCANGFLSRWDSCGSSLAKGHTESPKMPLRSAGATFGEKRTECWMHHRNLLATLVPPSGGLRRRRGDSKLNIRSQSHLKNWSLDDVPVNKRRCDFEYQNNNTDENSHCRLKTIAMDAPVRTPLRMPTQDKELVNDIESQGDKRILCPAA